MLTVDPQTFDLGIDAGDQEKLQFTLTKSDGTAFDGTGCVFTFLAKQSLEDASPVISISSVSQSAQWDLTQVNLGIVVLEFLPANTSTLGGAKLHYGLKVLDSVAKPHTPRQALFTVRKNAVL